MPQVFAATAALVFLYVLWGPTPVGDPNKGDYDLRWGVMKYYEPRYTRITYRLNEERLAGAHAAAPSGTRLCGTGFMEATETEEGGLDGPRVVATATLTLGILMWAGLICRTSGRSSGAPERIATPS